jgi:hypothetical protein
MSESWNKGRKEDGRVETASAKEEEEVKRRDTVTIL